MSNGLLKLDKDVLKLLIESVQTYALWVTLALAAILLAVGLIVKFKFSEKIKAFALIATGVVIGYAITLISVILFMQISRMVVKNELTPYFYMVVGLFAYTITAMIVCALIKIFKSNAFKHALYTCLALFAAYVTVILCVFPTDGDTIPLNATALIICTIILVIGIVLLSVLCDKSKAKISESKTLAYAGICVATSFALSYVKFFSLPQGGSVTLVSMLPLMAFSYMFGAKKGLIAGVIYGLLQLIQSPQIYQPLQVFLDYPIAFGSLALAGIFRNAKFLKGNKVLEFAFGMVVACVFRYISHVISGTFVFHYGAPFADAFIYSVGYNSFVLIDLALDVIAGCALMSSKAMQKQIDSINLIEE